MFFEWRLKTGLIAPWLCCSLLAVGNLLAQLPQAEVLVGNIGSAKIHLYSIAGGSESGSFQAPFSPPFDPHMSILTGHHLKSKFLAFGRAGS